MALELYEDPETREDLNEEDISFKTVCIREELAVEVANTEDIYEAGTNFADMGLDAEIIMGLRDIGITAPSVIQSNIFPYIFSENPRNIIAQSQSGTGKTVAYVLVALQVVDLSQAETQVIVITPTIELSYQVHEKIRTIGRYLRDLKVDLAIKAQHPTFGGHAHIVVGCLGTILKWLREPGVLNLASCRFILVDEADSVILQRNQLKQLFLVKKAIKQPCLHLLCSATYNNQAFAVAKKMMHNPMCMRLRPEQLSLDNIHQYYCKSNGDPEKIAMICKIIKVPGVVKTVIFCNRKEDARNICKCLQDLGVPALPLTGDMRPTDRTTVFDQFRTGNEYSVLISTDVCSRGIDINQVNAVINYHFPRGGKKLSPDYSSYYHRIGRGGRFGRKAISITLITNQEEFNFIKSAERYFKIAIPETKILKPGENIDMDSLTATTNRLHISQNRAGFS